MKKLIFVLMSMFFVSCSARDVNTASLNSEVQSFPLLAGQTVVFTSNVMLLWKEDVNSEQIIMTRKSLGDLGALKMKKGELQKEAQRFGAELKKRIMGLEPADQQQWMNLSQQFEVAYAEAQKKKARVDEIMKLPPEERDMEELKALNEALVELKKQIDESHAGKRELSADLFAFEMGGKQSLGQKQKELEKEAGLIFQTLAGSADLLAHPSKGVGPAKMMLSVDDQGNVDVTLDGMNVAGCVGDGIASSMANADARRNGVVQNIVYTAKGGKLSFDVHLDCGLKMQVGVTRSDGANGTKSMSFSGGMRMEREGKQRVGLAVFR